MPARHLDPFVVRVVIPRDHIRGIAELHCVIQHFYTDLV